MRRGMSWLSVDSDIAGDPKISFLPDNDYRWAWICLLGLEKQGRLEGEDVRMFAKYCDIHIDKFDQILEVLVELGLLDNGNRPNGFYVWQRRAQKRERDRKNQNDNETGAEPVPNRHQTGTKPAPNRHDPVQDRPSERDTNTNTDTDDGIKSPENPKADFPDEAIAAARLLAQLMVQNDPQARIPTTEKQKSKWLADINNIHRLDGRQWPEIMDVINWCQQDEFWKTNILSPAKLRKQFPKLRLAMRRPENLSVEEHNRRVLAEALRKEEQCEI